MQMSQGVEWGLHCCMVLGWAGSQTRLSTARLAAKFGLPKAYLNKSLQALTRAGILTSQAGPRGGFALSRAAGEISLLDVVTAIEGADTAFQCTEIRQKGQAPAPAQECRSPCGIAKAMYRAEKAWRDALADQTIADLMEEASVASRERTVKWVNDGTTRLTS